MMCFSLIMFRASGLSIRTQWSTSSTPTWQRAPSQHTRSSLILSWCLTATETIWLIIIMTEAQSQHTGFPPPSFMGLDIQRNHIAHYGQGRWEAQSQTLGLPFFFRGAWHLQKPSSLLGQGPGEAQSQQNRNTLGFPLIHGAWQPQKPHGLLRTGTGWGAVGGGNTVTTCWVSPFILHGAWHPQKPHCLLRTGGGGGGSGSTITTHYVYPFFFHGARHPQKPHCLLRTGGGEGGECKHIHNTLSLPLLLSWC